jgi:hypothetical protein
LTAARIVFSALLVYAVCTAAGQILLDRLKLRLDRAEWWFLGFLTGSAAISTVIFFLAALRRVTPAVLLTLSAIVLIARWKFVRISPTPDTSPPIDRRWTIVFWAVYLAFGIYYLCNAMAPETSSDGAVYHVGLVSRYFERHGFFPMRTNMFSNMPLAVEMLFLFAYSFGRHSAAAMVHLLFLLAMPFGMTAYARRMGQPLAGIAGALLFYAAPIVGKDGSVAYNDVATAAIVFGCFYAVEIWDQDRRPAALIPAGLLAGFAFAAKYTGVTAFVYAAGFVLVSCIRRRERPWRSLAAIALPGAIIALPWLIKNVVYVGNPVHPLLSAVFPNRYYSERMEQDLRTFLAHPNGIAYVQVPWQTTVGGALDGVLGPVFLLAPLALLSLRSTMGRRLLAAFAVVMLTYPGNLGARFLIPPLAFLALALAAAVAGLRLDNKTALWGGPPGPRPAPWPASGSALPVSISGSRGTRPDQVVRPTNEEELQYPIVALVALHVVLSWPPLMGIWISPGLWRLDEFDWRAALRLKSEDRYLALHMTEYRPGLMLDRFVPRGHPVYAPSVSQIAYHHTETVGSNLSLHVLDLLATGYMPGRETILRRRYAFPPVRTSSLRIVLDGRGDLPWKLGEVQFDIPRDPRWRVAASSNPWDIPLAFDGRTVSAWQSARNAQPGLWVQVDFGGPVDLSAITVEQPEDQRRLPMALEAAAKEGRFVRLQAAETIDERPFGPGLRRAAASEIKASGVEWLLLRTGDYGEEDLRLRAPYWEARLIAREGEFRLWKLD